MELQAACLLIYSILGQQKLSLQEHDQVESAFYQVAEKCKDEVKKAKEKSVKK